VLVPCGVVGPWSPPVFGFGVCKDCVPCCPLPFCGLFLALTLAFLFVSSSEIGVGVGASGGVTGACCGCCGGGGVVGGAGIGGGGGVRLPPPNNPGRHIVILRVLIYF